MLHIVNKSPLERHSLDSCLSVAQSGTLLLIEDGVYAVTLGHQGAAKIQQALPEIRVCALQADLAARGMLDRVIPGVELVDYAGFVGLVVSEPTSHSWL